MAQGAARLVGQRWQIREAAEQPASRQGGWARRRPPERAAGFSASRLRPASKVVLVGAIGGVVRYVDPQLQRSGAANQLRESGW